MKYILVLFGLLLCMSGVSQSRIDGCWAKCFVTELNRIRRLKGLSDVALDNSLTRHSHGYSKSMSRRYKGKPKLEHAASRFLWIKKYHGEVIAFNSSEHDPNSILTQWMNSPPHRRILLDRTISRIGASGHKGYFVARVKR